MRSLADFKGLVFDESHNLKNPQAQRTQAAAKLMEMVGPEYGRFFLTGTPILNRPEELIQPLLMLGFLSNAKGSKRTTTWFRNRFCKGTRRDAELRDLIRTFCLRRTKEQVLTELPEKQRADVWIDLTAQQRAVYRKRAEEGWERAQGTQAAAIVYINTLRRLTGEIKRQVALDWAKDFLASTDKQLVIFAYYGDTQKFLIDGLEDAGYRVARVLGSQRDTDAQVELFQGGGARVIVCSVIAASQGLTLTAASDVLMVEQEWRPGIHWQAEDRCHRMGQRDAVTAWYMLATGTIDEWLFGLISGKASLIESVGLGKGDGDAEEQAERQISTVAYLMGRLATQVSRKLCKE